MLTFFELLLLLSLPALAVVSVLRQRRAASPNGALLVCGRRGPMNRGYALVRGTTMVLPLLEAAEEISLEPLELQLERRLRTRIGAELDVEIAATIRFPQDAKRLLETLELAPTSRDALAQLAEDALAGSAAHVVSTAMPLHIADDSASISQAIGKQARLGLQALGLELERVTLTPSRGAPLPA